MKAFKYIAFLLLIAIIGTAIYISVQPNNLEITKSRNIKAPAVVIFNHVIDFKTWGDWSARVEADPNLTFTLPENTKGIDAFYSWEDKDGFGTIKTLDAVANEYIRQQMEHGKIPSSEIMWNFAQNANGSTDVTWTILAKDLPFGFKANKVFSEGFEDEIAAEFERSLEKLDSVIIAEMNKYSIVINGITNHSGGYYLYNTASSKINDLQSKINEMLPKVMEYAQKNNIAVAGHPFINYLKWDEANNAVIFSSCVPTSEQVITAEGDNILTGNFANFKAIKTTLKGNYNHLDEARKQTKTYIPENGFEFAIDGPMLETYLNNPANTPNPANLVTEIYIAIKDSIE